MSSCPSIVVVPAAFQRRLKEWRADIGSGEELSCDFDVGHPGGEHWTIAVYGGADRQSEDVWLRWRDGEGPVLVEHPGCKAYAPSGDEQGPYCYWVADHPGLHSTGDERW